MEVKQWNYLQSTFNDKTNTDMLLCVAQVQRTQQLTLNRYATIGEESSNKNWCGLRADVP
jgi:hypothetical protein